MSSTTRSKFRASALLSKLVTQEQYERVMGKNPSQFKGPQNPVETVSWDDAVEFCRKLSALPEEKEAGRLYRLPTEAEWEYACRAGSEADYCFGDDKAQLDQYAWYDKNSGGTTQAVGLKKPNEWGLYDVHGNVWEWCADWYDEKWYQQSPERDPVGPQTGERRVLRGGGWDFNSNYCSAWFRVHSTPWDQGLIIGFRLARTLLPDG